ncbi:hypothetical protein SAMN04488074_101850 [Lentzea albidocapillata subsp. violacea]|uniref:Peptidase inhibitor family I36 n=1 Tax=Lentzea albidocapillata subsp. violacea TaxID=128104 RepID=A0A1G8S1K1_9PSEU|nr:hypothetical protein [Lentzea albidocapillata]SDJ23099.1 hypothetical protein SAMN04488074_101850 [Lentzea albidocapillata subsp. violacea]
MRFVSVAAVAAFTLAGLSSGIAHAESAPGCGPVTQIGRTAYIDQGGGPVASVKQFKGCGKNWAYTYVWDSFHNKGHQYYVTAGIIAGGGSKGHVKGTNRDREVWSTGTATLSVCTYAQGSLVDNPEHAYTANTDTRC